MDKPQNMLIKAARCTREDELKNVDAVYSGGSFTMLPLALRILETFQIKVLL